jgi:hypothetical protein
MFRFLTVAVLILLANHVATAEEKRPEVGKYAKVFKSWGSAGNLTVTMVRIGPKKNNEYLIQFSGIDSDYDGKIIKHTCRVWGGNNEKIDCCTDKIRGKNYCSLIGRGGWFGQFFEAALPDLQPNPTKVAPDKNAATQVIPEHFLTEYLNQLSKAKANSKKK